MVGILTGLVYLFLNGFKVHKQLGLVFVLYKWFGSVSRQETELNRNRTMLIASVVLPQIRSVMCVSLLGHKLHLLNVNSVFRYVGSLAKWLYILL